MTIICADCGRAIDSPAHLCTPKPQPTSWNTDRDLVPGYADSADGRADAADQRKADAR